MNAFQTLKKLIILMTIIIFQNSSAQQEEQIHGGPIHAIEKFTLSNGGGEMATVGDFYQITGSIGQLEAGHLASSNGGYFKVSGGFFTSDINDDIIFKNGFD